MKYIVMECHPGYAVVLDKDGGFLKVANMRYEVGQTVTNVVELNLPQIQERSAKRSNRKWMASLVTMAACLALVVTSVFFAGQMPYASVYMTINPEVRIDVNRRDVVVGVDGVNMDGEELLKGYDYKKKDLDLVMDELVDRAIDMGYLHEGSKITLTLDADDDWIVSHSEHITTHLNEYLTEKISVSIDVTGSAIQQPSQNSPQHTQQSATQNQTVVIPVGPESDYGESDYGESSPVLSDSPYGNGDDGQSGYADLTNEDDGQTDYGTLEEPDIDLDNGQSEYVPDDIDSDDGQLDYDSDNDGQSDYDFSDDDLDDESEDDD